MKLTKTCNAQPGHKEFVRKDAGIRPTVLSSKRFEGILSRSRQDERREVLAAVEEEQRYKQYLKDGSDALLKNFTGYNSHQVTDEDALQATRDELLIEKTKNQRAKQLLDEQRKERIMRANHILHLLKPGPRALHQALLQSETIQQRKYNDAINADIAQDALRQKRLQDQQCPEVLIPFGETTEEQEKAEEKKKSLNMREYFLQDLEQRRQSKQDARKKEIYDAIIEREQYKLLQDKEEQAAKELKASRREFYRNAYKEALKEKAEIAKFENICEQIDDRIRCVTKVAQRNLESRFGKQVQDMREDQKRKREARAVQFCQEQQEKRRREEMAQAKREEQYEAEVNMDEIGRKCRQEQLSKQRCAYEQEERKLEGEKREKDAQIRRFEMATRLRNAEANQRFFNAEKQRQEEVTKNLREVLSGQRQEYLKRREDELIRTTACQDDPNLQDDVDFFDNAAQLMEESQELGRPLYPLAKAVEGYKRDNQIDLVPEGQTIRRNTVRDVCWPGYISKAELAYKKYEHREECRQENEKQRQKILDNCLKITKLAAAERPFKPCAPSGQIKCRQYKDMPLLGSTKSSEEDPNLPLESVDLTEISQPEEDREANTLDKKESKQSIATKRGSGGLDLLPNYKRDGISRSLIGVVSTKQKRSSRFPDATTYFDFQHKESIGSSQKRSTRLSNRKDLTRSDRSARRSSAKLPNLKECFSSNPPTARKESTRSPGSKRGSGRSDHSATSYPKRATKLPDLSRYLNPKPQALQKSSVGQSDRPLRGYGVADLLAPDVDSALWPSSKRSRKLPDLTQYWTPKLMVNKEQSKDLPSKDLGANKSNTKVTWPTDRK